MQASAQMNKFGWHFRWTVPSLTYFWAKRKGQRLSRAFFIMNTYIVLILITGFISKEYKFSLYFSYFCTSLTYVWAKIDQPVFRTVFITDKDIVLLFSQLLSLGGKQIQFSF